MKKIICCLTPNPALDVSGSVEKNILNEKTYVHDPLIKPGGNSINAARILTRLQVPVVATGFLGGGIGQEIQELLDQEKVKNNFIQIHAQSRISVTVSNQKDQQTRLSFPGPSIRSEEKEKIFKWMSGHKGISHLIIGGSLPPGFSSKDIVRMIHLAQKSGIRVVIDCPGKILKQVVSKGAFLIKPNLREFQELTGTKVHTISAVRKAAHELLKKVEFVCVSSVEGGALLMSREATYFGRIAPVKIRSTVGAGDSMVGGMMSQFFHENFSIDEVLRWGLAASAATLAQTGTTLGSAAEIRRLYKRTKVQLYE